MKSRLNLFALALLIIGGTYAQSPQGFNYQAVIRNASGEVLSNQAVGVRMTLIQGAANGSTIYAETFSKTTNAFGLIDLVIGTGTVTTGSFSTIDWAAGPFFLETAIDNSGGSNYVVLGTSQLMSVPFALYAESSGGGMDGADGASAYEIWLAAGNTGSEADFLASLQGEVGPAGADGADGEDGTGLTPTIQAEIDSNTAKVGITTDQAAAIVTNSADPDVDETNELQDISLSGTNLSITDGSTVDLSGIDTDTNTQLSESEVDAFVANNGYLTSFSEVDGDVTNELQTISRADEFVVLSNGGGLASVEDDDADPANELQTISRADEFVVMSNSGGMVSVEDDDADPLNEIQQISTDTNPGNITISGGATLALNVDDADADPLNEVNTTIELNGTDLETTDAGGTITTDLSSLVNDGDADPLNETNTGIILNGTDLETTDADGTIITDLSSLVDDADADSSNELQEISTDNTPGNITITDGATLALNVDDGDADAMNEIQDLEVIGDTLFVTGNSTPTKVLLGGRNSYGDIKHSLRLTDHDGWYKLDGRALSALPETAAQVAADFFVGNLPDATDRFLKGNDGVETNGDVGGSNAITIAQENLQNFNLPVTEDVAGLHNHTASSASAGSHTHTITSISGVGSTNNRVIGGDSGGNDGNKSTNASGIHTHTITVDNDGNHVHNVGVSSGGNGLTPIPKPSYLATNIFVYLGSATLGDLQNLGLSNQEILTSGVSPLTLWNDDNAILDDLLGLDYNGSPIALQTFVDQGIDLTFLYTQYDQALLDDTSVTTLDLFNDGVTIATLDGNGITIATMRMDGISMTNIYASTLYTFQNLRNGGFAIDEIVTLTTYQTMVDLGVATYQEFLDVPTSPQTLWNANNGVLDDLLGLTYLSNPITLQTFVDQTISLTFLYGQYVNDVISLTTVTTLDLFNDGVAISDMNSNGVNLAVMVADGITIMNLDAAGVYSLQQLKDQFDAASMLTIATVAELLNETTGTDITVFELRAGGATAADFYGVAYEGGLIFYTETDGTTYIADITDVSSGIVWTTATGSMSTNSNIGSGLTNSQNIVAFEPAPAINAASICLDLNTNGFDDWYLPSENELIEMYNNLKANGDLGGFSNVKYWSSTRGNSSEAQGLDFADGSALGGGGGGGGLSERDRLNLYRVRAIRSFDSVPD